MSNWKSKIIFVLELMLMTCLYAIFDNVGGIKKYAIVLAVAMIFFLMGWKKKWSLEVLICIALPATAYVLLGSFSALISVNSLAATVKVALYWIVPLLLALSMYICYKEKMSYLVDVQFWGSCIGYKLFDSPMSRWFRNWESVYSFAFGIFTIYYGYKKKWPQFFVALLFMILAEKRITILAVVAALFVLAVLKLFEENKKLVIGFWGMIIAVVYGYLYFISSGLMEAVCWAMNINTNGRVEIYSRVANEFGFSAGFLGKGLGTVEHLLECWNISEFVNLHNDILKFYVELGFIGLLLFLLSYVVVFHLVEKWFGKSKMSYLFVVMLYSVLLFATDNVSIYIIYTFPLYSTFFAVLSSEERQTHAYKTNELEQKRL